MRTARFSLNIRLQKLNLRLLVVNFCALACFAASDPVAARLAREAREAQNSGQLVRAYLLFAEAAAREPGNSTYRANRDALAPVAQLLAKANIENAEISSDIKAAGATNPSPPATAKASSESPPAGEPGLGTETSADSISAKQIRRIEALAPLPKLIPDSSLHDFDLRADEKSLFHTVASTYGIRVIVDPEMQPEHPIHFQIDQADFRTAMDALTAATNTFVFPVSADTVFFARNTASKRSQLEPMILLTVPVPDALDQKELAEAANAVRGALNLRSMAFDSETREIVVRDRVSKARVARSLLQALVLPRAQVSIEVQLLTVDSDRIYHYGLSLPTTFQLLDFGHIGGFQNILASVSTPMNFLAFGGGATLFGVGLADATIFAMYSKSFATNLYDAAVVVDNGQAANFHVGDKYPIPQSLYTGFQQTGSSALYNPIGEVTMEDLGLVLKLTPRVNGDSEVSLDVEAQFKALGSQKLNTVPTINQREFKGGVVLREGEWAVLAGIDEDTHTVTRNGLPGISQIPGLNQLLSENTREDKTEKTLLVIKPTITRLPMSAGISPQYLLGPSAGPSVVF
ncbi:MAG: hypothetical protein JOY62_17345 [Acidobacteriaceae bacterium]|nr:hypothetical protein [Acidobacteriaceae bacterium]